MYAFSSRPQQAHPSLVSPVQPSHAAGHVFLCDIRLQDWREVQSLYHGQRSASHATVASAGYMSKSSLCMKKDDKIRFFFLIDSMGDCVGCFGGGMIYYL